ncbi:hypothetical protein N302_07292, partial [Corvus brachyrhynchos]
LFSKNIKEIKARVRVRHAAPQQLQVRQVLVGVGVEEALGVVAGVGQDLAHLLVKVATLVGRPHRPPRVRGAVGPAGGDLGLEQADAVIPDDQLLLHGLEQGDFVARIGVRVARHGPLGRQQLLVQLAAPQPGGHSLVHRELLVLDWVDQEAGGRLCLQQHQRRALPQDALPHGLVDAHLLHLARLGLGGHQHAGNDARAVQVALDRGHLRHLLHRLGALHQVGQRVRVDDARVQQVRGAHLPPEACEFHAAAALRRLL